MRMIHALSRFGSMVVASVMLFLLPSAAMAASGEAAPSVVVVEKAYHFGKVRQGEVIEHSFVVKNKGEGILRIGRVKPG